MKDFIITTERLTIRPIKDSDREFSDILSDDTPYMRLIPEGFNARDAYWDILHMKDIFAALVFLKESGETVGYVSMTVADDGRAPEVGVYLLKKHRNKGFGPEALSAFCERYAEEHGLDKIRVRISCDNHHSIHVFEKLGAEYVGSSPTVLGDALADGELEKMLTREEIEELSLYGVREYVLRFPG